MKLFISHSEKDRNLVDDFVDLLFVIGLKKEDIFYLSLIHISEPTRRS